MPLMIAVHKRFYLRKEKVMYKALLRLLAWTSLACLPLVLGGCGGGGGGGGTVPTTTVSGIAMKGPISGALVRVFKLTTAGAPGDLLGSGTSASDGKYAVAIPTSEANGPLLITVSGQNGAAYLSESLGTDVAFSSSESFSAVITAAGQNITVSPLTEAAYQKLQQILTQNPGLATADNIAGAINAANRRIGSLLGISDILADPAGDITYQAALLIVDQMIVDLRNSPATASANTLTVMSIINQAFADVAGPAYQTYLQALTVAANAVKAANPTNQALLAAIDAIVALAGNPPAELDLTDTTPPTTPTNLTAATFALTATTSSVVLSWSPSTDNQAVGGYEVFRDGVKIATVTTPGYTDTPVTSSITYTYFVVAFDVVGNRSGASNSLTVTPNQASLNVTFNGQLSSGILGLPRNDIFPPTAPTGLVASTTALSATNSSVTLNWNAASDDVAVTGYEVFRNGAIIATVTTTSYTDPSVTSNVTFTYFIVAFDAAGNRSIAGNQLLVTPNQASLGVTVNGQVNPG
jgi:chitodextrinase